MQSNETEFKIGASTSVWSENGSQLYELTKNQDLEIVRASTDGKAKEALPCLYVYTGCKGTYSPTNIMFIDIDTTERVDEFIGKKDEVFLSIPCIKFIQKSHSGKLHIICLLPKAEPTKEDWSQACKLTTFAVIELINRDFGIDWAKEKVLDEHNMRWTHALYVSRHPFYENAHCFPISISSKDADGLRKKYSNWFKDERKAESYKPVTDIDIDGLTLRDSFEKIAIDRNFKIGKKSGNDIRYRIVDVLYLVFNFTKEQVQDFIATHFSNPNDFGLRKYAGHHIDKYTERVRDWLVAEYFTKKDETQTTIEVEQYITEKYGYLKKLIQKEKRLLIQADTGMGKTVTMHKLANELNAVVIVPFNAMLQLYSKDRTVGGMKLKGLLEISSTSSNAYTEKKPCVMVWDQAVKYDLDDRWVISDETHQWFFDRDYREKAVTLLNKAKQWKKLVCISATPAGEAEELGISIYKFTKKDTKRINTIFYETPQPDVLMKHIIDLQSYTTVVFSDRYARTMWENYPDSLLLHKDRKNTDEFQATISNERIDNHLSFCTKIAFNGLNFNNEEPVHAIVCVREGEDCANTIIQAAGRFRKSSNVSLTICFVPENPDNEDTFESKVNDANITKELVESKEGKDTELHYDKRLTDPTQLLAMTEIERYMKAHSHKAQILSDLNDTGKFNIIIHEFKTFKGEKGLRRVKKQAESDALKKAIVEGSVIKDKTQFQIDMTHAKNLLDEQCIIDWPMQISLHKADALIDGIIDYVRFAFNIAKLTDEQFSLAYDYSKIEWLANKGASKNLLGAAKRKFDKAHNIRKRWEIKYGDYDKPIEDILIEFLDIAVEVKSEQKTKGRLKMKEAGAKNAKCIIVKNKHTDEVIEFERKTDARNHFGKKQYEKILKNASTDWFIIS